MLRSHHNFCRGFSRVLAVSGWLCTAASAAAATIGPAAAIGTISSILLREASGIVDSRANSNVFWVHNDSGDSARFFAINHQGALLGAFTLSGASAIDWEDAAIGPKPGGGNYLYFADIGDNPAARSSVDVYRVTEPPSTGGATILASDYSRARLQYPGGAQRRGIVRRSPDKRSVHFVKDGNHPVVQRRPASSGAPAS